MTMLYAAEYNPEEMGRRELSSPLSSLIAHMTTDDYDDRTTLDAVLQTCEYNLNVMGRNSEQICQQLASAVRLNSSAEGESHYLDYLSINSVMTNGPTKATGLFKRVFSTDLGTHGSHTKGHSVGPLVNCYIYSNFHWLWILKSSQFGI